MVEKVTLTHISSMTAALLPVARTRTMSARESKTISSRDKKSRSGGTAMRQTPGGRSARIKRRLPMRLVILIATGLNRRAATARTATARTATARTAAAGAGGRGAGGGGADGAGGARAR